MRLEHADPAAPKGWSLGAWNSALPVNVGYAYTGVDEPHEHARLTEIYLVARGPAEIRIERTTLTLRAGAVLCVEPGEAHTFLSASADYFHFVLHVPGLAGAEARAEKRAVPRERLGL